MREGAPILGQMGQGRHGGRISSVEGRRETPNGDFVRAVEVKDRVKEADKLHTGQNTQLNDVISWGGIDFRLFCVPVTLLLEDGCSMAYMSFLALRLIFGNHWKGYKSIIALVFLNVSVNEGSGPRPGFNYCHFRVA